MAAVSWWTWSPSRGWTWTWQPLRPRPANPTYVRPLAGRTAHRTLLMQLADDADPKVRAGVAWNRFAGQLWTTLAKDPQRQVRAAVAGNPHAPDELMTTFTTDRSADVRWGAVSTGPHNPNVVAPFIYGPDPSVADHARLHLRAPAEGIFEPDGSVLWQYPWEDECPLPQPTLDDPQGDVLGMAAHARQVVVEARLRGLPQGPARHDR